MIRYDDMGMFCLLKKKKNWFSDFSAAKAVAQNEYMDFLRDIVPNTIPLSMAMKMREERNHTESDQAQNEAGKARDEDAGTEMEANTRNAMNGGDATAETDAHVDTQGDDDADVDIEAEGDGFGDQSMPDENTNG